MTSRLQKLGGMVLVWVAMTAGAVAAPEYITVDYAGATGTSLCGVSGDYAVGNYVDSYGASHGFKYTISQPNFTAINVDSGDISNVDAGSTQAYGISGNKIAGSYTVAGVTHGFVYDGTNYRTVDVASADSSIVHGISGNYAVGYSTTGAISNAFVYDLTNPGAPKVVSLGVKVAGIAMSTFGYGISGNTIVGYYYDGSIDHAFSYTITDSTFDLAELDISASLVPVSVNTDSTDANGISGSNIVGFSTGAGGYYHGFVYDGTDYNLIDDTDSTTTDTALYGVDSETGTAVGFTLRPDPNDSSTSVTHGLIVTSAVVPEPTTYALIGLGLLVMVLSRRKTLFASLR